MNVDPVLIGIVAGVIAGILLFAGANIIQTIIIPWYRTIIYQGIDISGEWHYKLESPAGTKGNGVVQIKQHATALTATITSTQERNSDSKEIKIFSLKGEINDRLVSFIGLNINRRQIGRQVYLLEIIEGGDKMKGQISWFSVAENTVTSLATTWVRKNT